MTPYPRSRARFVLAWLGGSLMTAALLLSFRAAADGDPDTDDLPRLLPYSGTLEKDGTPWTGVVDMTFSLYEGEAGATSLWSETQTVSVFKGAFTVTLGSKSTSSASTLGAAIAQADDLWVAVSLKTTGGTTTALAERKRIVPVPYAMVTTAVAGAPAAYAGHQLVIESDLTMSASGSDGPLTITDSSGDRMTMDGDDIDSNDELWLNPESDQTTTFGGSLTIGGDSLYLSNVQSLVHLSGDGLQIDAVPSGAWSDNTKVDIDGPVTFNGDVTGLSVTWTLPNSGNTCTDYNLQDRDGASEYYYFCPEGTVLVGGLWQGYVGNNSKALEVVRCCGLSAISVK